MRREVEIIRQNLGEFVRKLQFFALFTEIGGGYLDGVLLGFYAILRPAGVLRSRANFG